MHSVKGTIELVTTPGLVNLDFADVQTIPGSGGMAMIGLGESAGADRTADNDPEMDHDRNQDLDTIDYKEPQERAKATGISADQSKDALVDALLEGVSRTRGNERRNPVAITGCRPRGSEWGIGERDRRTRDVDQGSRIGSRANPRPDRPGRSNHLGDLG